MRMNLTFVAAGGVAWMFLATTPSSAEPLRDVVEPLCSSLEADFANGTPKMSPNCSAPVADGRHDVLEISLTAARGPAQIGDFSVANAYLYNGSYIPEVWRLDPGDKLQIDFRNDLDNGDVGFRSNLHTHGLIVSPNNVARDADDAARRRCLCAGLREGRDRRGSRRARRGRHGSHPQFRGDGRVPDPVAGRSSDGGLLVSPAPAPDHRAAGDRRHVGDHGSRPGGRLSRSGRGRRRSRPPRPGRREDPDAQGHADHARERRFRMAAQRGVRSRQLRGTGAEGARHLFRRTTTTRGCSRSTDRSIRPSRLPKASASSGGSPMSARTRPTNSSLSRSPTTAPRSRCCSR